MKTNAFEVEDISLRTNYVFKKTEKCIELWNTSIRQPRRLETTLGEVEADNIGVPKPYSIDAHFKFLYDKACEFNPAMPIHFLGWVDPDTFQPFEEE